MIKNVSYKTISYNATIKYKELSYKTIKYIERCLLSNLLMSNCH